MGSDRPNRQRTPRLSAGRVRMALLGRTEDLFHAAFGPPVHARSKEWRARENTALSMCMRGPKRGLWMDHSADAGGDLMDLIALLYCGLPSARSDFQLVLKQAAAFAGVGAESPGPGLKRKPARTPEDDTRQQAYQAALLDALLSRARPVANSRAAVYLASRGITHLPERGLNDLPPVPGLPVRSAHLPALVVWATTPAGTVCGGQRILLRDDGRAADVEVRKPAFGRIAGCPARFPAVQASSEPPPRQAHAKHAAGRTAQDGPAHADAPLVIAEGPETALAIGQACACETWAVFGVSGWKTAPLPPRDTVILAPDRDAVGSPAGRAFTRAVKHHLDAQRRFRVAAAPEPEGSKRDLADTLLRAGEDALRTAIAEAVPARQALKKRKQATQKEKEKASNARQ